MIEYLTEQEVLNMDTNYIIETKNLTKQYGSQKSVADLNIHVKRGRIYGLLGRNGAGKTTTMKMLLGLTKPTSGEVKIWGTSLQGNEKKLLPRIGSLIESPGFYPNLTARENLRIFATLRGVPNSHAIRDALDLVGLPYKDKKLFSQYSLGMKQRLAIALAVMHDPELLILDEPINGLDPIVKTEFYKLKRYHILWAGVALMLLSVLLTLFTSMANDGSVWDFAYLTEQVIKNNMSMIFPMCISLIAGYMISREQTDDTLKNILTVPISFKKLLTGKLIVCGVLSIIFGLICSLFTIIAEMIVGFPGFEISLALKAALQITAVNFFLYLAVLPIIALTCRRAGSFLVGVIIAFVYGYGGMFAAGNMTLANLYPITASLGMVGYRSYDTAVNWNIGTCSCSLALAVVISTILILCMKEREATQTKKKAKKVAPKKGW